MIETRSLTRDTSAETLLPAAALVPEPEGTPLGVSSRTSLAGCGAEAVDRALSVLAERLAALSLDVERLRALLDPMPDAPETNSRLADQVVLMGRRRGSAGVSKREHGVLRHLLDGLSNREISRELGIAEKTVKNHLWKLYRKLGVRNRTQLFHSLIAAPPTDRSGSAFRP